MRLFRASSPTELASDPAPRRPDVLAAQQVPLAWLAPQLQPPPPRAAPPRADGETLRPTRRGADAEQQQHPLPGTAPSPDIGRHGDSGGSGDEGGLKHRISGWTRRLLRGVHHSAEGDAPASRRASPTRADDEGACEAEAPEDDAASAAAAACYRRALARFDTARRRSPSPAAARDRVLSQYSWPPERRRRDDHPDHGGGGGFAVPASYVNTGWHAGMTVMCRNGDPSEVRDDDVHVARQDRVS